jgi:hypothetical protein
MFQSHDREIEARDDRAAGLQDRFDDSDARESSADSQKLWTDPLATLTHPVALEAERLFHVVEQLATPLGIPNRCQDHPVHAIRWPAFESVRPRSWTNNRES